MIKTENGTGLLSIAATGILMMLICWLRFVYPPDNVLSWDVLGYYLYLPAKFIYHDLGLNEQEWLHALIAKYQSTDTLYQAYVGPSGGWVMKYPIGMSVMYAPFFFVAHWLAPLMGYPADGLSAPYQYGIAVGGILYSLVGLLFLRSVLNRYFSDGITAGILILIVLGTNYINQATVANLMSHNFLFTLLAALVWASDGWIRSPKWFYMILTGILCGLITLIRPSEAVCVLIPALWGIWNRETLRWKIGVFVTKKWQVLATMMLAILVIFPQLYYWKRHTGFWFFYSYPNPGEGLDWFSPHIADFLLSFRKGWFVYTPLVLFMLAGFPWVWKRKRELFWPLMLYSVVSLYIMASWTCWWYAGGCYSQRAATSLYVVLAFPAGYMLRKLHETRWLVKAVAVIALSAMIALNLFQFWQFHREILNRDRMTWKYYKAIFAKTRVPENAGDLLLVSRSSKGYEAMPSTGQFHKKIIGIYTFSQPGGSENQKYIKDPIDTSNSCLLLDGEHIYSPGLSMKYKNITGEYYAWIKASAEVFIPGGYSGETPLLVTTFDHNGGSYKYYAGGWNVNPENRDKWQKITIDYLTPEVRCTDDELKVYVWHRSEHPVYLRNLIIEAYDPIIK